MSDPIVEKPGTTSFLSGGGEIGVLIRELDWASTPLGPPSLWPQQLQTLTAVMLGSGHPMFIAWGPERIMIYNDGYASLLGMKHPRALGTPFEQVWSDIAGDVSPIMDRAFDGHAIHMGDITFLMRDRHGYPEEAHFTFSYTPVRDGDEDVAGVFCACTETTESVFALRRLRLLDEMNQRTRSLSNPQEVMQVTSRLLGEHLQATRCAYADVQTGGNRFTIRDDWTDGAPSTIGEYRLDDFGPRIASSLREGRTLVIQDVRGEYAGAEGAEMFLAMGVEAIICCPLVSDQGLTALMAVHNSIPRVWRPDEVRLVETVVERSWAHIQKIRSEEKLRAQDAYKDEFLATLAHELRNPLAPLRTGLEVLDLAQGDAAKSREVRAMMKRQLGVMVRLIDDLLDLSRVGRGLMELREHQIDLRIVASSAVETSRPLMNSRGHHLSVSLADEPVTVKGDATRMIQVLSNLLNNAAKYTPPGGRISLTVDKRDDIATVCVVDNGIGIPEEKLGDIFEMFRQIGSTPRSSESGLGIGLTLARKLVEMHGGTILAESDGIGMGSTFTVSLPLAVAETGRSSGDHGTVRVAPSASEPLRVLVVDDDEDTVLLMSMLISMRGHEVEKASTGKEALATVPRFRPHVMFLDIGLPSLDGYDVARAIREQADSSSIHLVALTGWGGEEDKARALEAGFDRHLTKPVDGASIAAILSETAKRNRRSPL